MARYGELLQQPPLEGEKKKKMSSVPLLRHVSNARWLAVGMAGFFKADAKKERTLRDVRGWQWFGGVSFSRSPRGAEEAKEKHASFGWCFFLHARRNRRAQGRPRFIAPLRIPAANWSARAAAGAPQSTRRPTGRPTRVQIGSGKRESLLYRFCF